MVVGVPHKLRRWWEDIKQEYDSQVRQMLGFLNFLMYIAPDRYLIKSLLKFWDPAKVVFRFKDFELTPTLEEICGFTELLFQGRKMLLPHQ